MKITQSTLVLSAAGLLFSCYLTPLSYSAEKAAPTPRQQFISIVNLAEESSANTVTQNNGVIEFKGNELVDAVAAAMASSGTLPPDSTLANGKDMAKDFKTAATPLALVEKELHGATSSPEMALDAINKNVVPITRQAIGVPLGKLAHFSTPEVLSSALPKISIPTTNLSSNNLGPSYRNEIPLDPTLIGSSYVTKDRGGKG